jgi:hypothetical protein
MLVPLRDVGLFNPAKRLPRLPATAHSRNTVTLGVAGDPHPRSAAKRAVRRWIRCALHAC